MVEPIGLFESGDFDLVDGAPGTSEPPAKMRDSSGRNDAATTTLRFAVGSS